MHEASDKKLIELRIARAYMDILLMPDISPGLQRIPLARIGSHEIRLFLHTQSDSVDATLFWIELFDHVTGASIDSCACRELPYAADVFEEFRHQAERTEAGRRQA
jgi:hypothetical protein